MPFSSLDVIGLETISELDASTLAAATPKQARDNAQSYSFAVREKKYVSLGNEWLISNLKYGYQTQTRKWVYIVVVAFSTHFR